MKISIGAQAFLLELGTGKDGIDSYSAVFMMESWGTSPEDVLAEVSKLQLVMSVQEPDGQEIIFLTTDGLYFLKEISSKIANHAWFRNKDCV